MTGATPDASLATTNPRSEPGAPCIGDHDCGLRPWPSDTRPQQSADRVAVDVSDSACKHDRGFILTCLMRSLVVANRQSVYHPSDAVSLSASGINDSRYCRRSSA